MPKPVRESPIDYIGGSNDPGAEGSWSKNWEHSFTPGVPPTGSYCDSLPPRGTQQQSSSSSGLKQFQGARANQDKEKEFPRASRDLYGLPF